MQLCHIMIIQEGKIIPNQKVKNTNKIINDNDKTMGRGKHVKTSFKCCLQDQTRNPRTCCAKFFQKMYECSSY